MKTGSVIVDLAAEQGGNCELTEPGRVVRKDGVTIIGYTDLPSRLPTQASQLYATNLKHLLSDMCPKKDGNVVVDFNDEVVRGATVVKDGQITWPPPAPKLSAAPVKTDGARGLQTPGSAGSKDPASIKHGHGTSAPASARGSLIAAGIAALSLYFVGAYAPAEFLQHFTVFVLACFVGYMVVWNVTPALHTPLMSVTNAISSIIIIGGLIQISDSDPVVMWIAGVTVTLTAINITGGFAVTQRMLGMFRK
jgi:NAD(P) transhydrogenase subunit alpha